MSPWLLLAAAALTYASRALAVAVLPAPPPRLHATLDRMPGPLFAGLAVLAIIDAGSTTPGVLGATVGALLLASLRSMLASVLGGIAGFAVTTLLL